VVDRRVLLGEAAFASSSYFLSNFTMRGPWLFQRVPLFIESSSDRGLMRLPLLRTPAVAIVTAVGNQSNRAEQSDAIANSVSEHSTTCLTSVGV
jgi:hypothetical protein